MQYAFGLFYTLAGAIACLALVAVSDWGYSRASIFIYEDADVVKLERFSLRDLMESIRFASTCLDGCSVVKHMAVTEDDVARSLHNRFAFAAGAKNLSRDEIRYALRVAEGLGLIGLDGRYIECDGFGRHSSLARHMYEEWVRSGSGIPPGTAGKLLKENRVLMPNGWLGHGAGVMALVGDADERLDSLLRTFSKDRAALLLDLINCNIMVIVC